MATWNVLDDGFEWGAGNGAAQLQPQLRALGYTGEFFGAPQITGYGGESGNVPEYGPAGIHPDLAAFLSERGYKLQARNVGNDMQTSVVDANGGIVGDVSHYNTDDASLFEKLTKAGLIGAAGYGAFSAISGLGGLGGAASAAPGATSGGVIGAGEGAAQLAAYTAANPLTAAGVTAATLPAAGLPGLSAAAAGAGLAAGAGGAAAAGGAATTAGQAAAGAGFWGSALKTVAPVLGSIAGGLIQSNAAGNAAGAQVSAAQAGAEAIRKALEPYQQAGVTALGGQQDLLGLNGTAKQQAAIDALRSSPAFTSMQTLGENRILQNASATGGLRGGNVQGALGQFSPAILSQLIEQQYGRLGGMVTTGANAAAGVGTAQANAQTQIGSAQAGQALANGSALGNIVNSGFGALGQYLGNQQTPSAAPGMSPAITTQTPFGQFQLGGGF